MGSKKQASSLILTNVRLDEALASLTTEGGFKEVNFFSHPRWSSGRWSNLHRPPSFYLRIF